MNEVVEIEKKILENQESDSEQIKESIDKFFKGLISFQELEHLLAA